MKLDEIKKVLAGLIDLGEMADKIKNAPAGVPAKVMTAFSFAIACSTDLIALGTISSSELKAEIASLDDGAKAELVQFFKDKLVLEEKELEAKIEEALDLLVYFEIGAEKAIALVKGKAQVAAV